MRPRADDAPDPALVPKRSRWLMAWFRGYAEGYVRKHLHAVRLSKAGGVPDVANVPTLVVLNHPAWWDPMACIALSRKFMHRQHFAPIDAAQLRQYRFFGRLGFFGVEQENPRALVPFLATARAILASPGGVLWVTAQGDFRDARVRPIVLRTGVGHVAARLGRGLVVPLALEYPFWTESKPEALCRFGTAIDVGANPGLDGKAWTAKIAAALESTMDALAAEAVARDPALFETLLTGESGVGGVYDAWRWLKAKVRGRRFSRSHSAERDTP